MWFWVIGVILVLVGCGSNREQDSALSPDTVISAQPKVPDLPEAPQNIGDLEDEPKIEEISWVAHQTEVRCAAANCPSQVGILLFLSAGQTADRIDVRRCTATLIAPNEILTTGHCDHSSASGYFVLGKGSSKQVRRIRSLKFKLYDPTDDGSERRTPAIAIFQLEQPINTVKPLSVASRETPRRIFSRLTGYVINADGDTPNAYRVDAVACTVRRHESLFPYDLSEIPDLIFAFDCRTEKGNSGSPLFIPGQTEIQAVLQGTVDPGDAARDTRRKLKRALQPAESHWVMASTNVRCVEWPGHKADSSCTSVTDEESNRRFKAVQEDFYAQLTARALDSDGRFQFKSIPFELKSSGNDFDRQYEILYWPTCRKASLDASEIELPSEWVKVSFDSWARPVLSSVGVRNSAAQIIGDSGRAVTMDMQWSKAFGPLMHESHHPRATWGRRFSIDLPPCAG